jgi:DNA modification methylase
MFSGDNDNNPTQKLLDQELYIIERVTEENSIVLSGYSGSGTTAVSSAMLNWHSISVIIITIFYQVLPLSGSV